MKPKTKDGLPVLHSGSTLLRFAEARTVYVKCIVRPNPGGGEWIVETTADDPDAYLVEGPDAVFVPAQAYAFGATDGPRPLGGGLNLSAWSHRYDACDCASCRESHDEARPADTERHLRCPTSRWASVYATYTDAQRRA